MGVETLGIQQDATLSTPSKSTTLQKPEQGWDSTSRHPARRCLAVALEIGGGTPATGREKLELRSPRGSARAYTARVGPMRAGRGRPSGVRDCHFAAGRRTAPVLDVGERLFRPVPQEVLETPVEGPRKARAEGPLCVRRDRGPTPPQPQFLPVQRGRPRGAFGRRSEPRVRQSPGQPRRRLPERLSP